MSAHKVPTGGFTRDGRLLYHVPGFKAPKTNAQLAFYASRRKKGSPGKYARSRHYYAKAAVSHCDKWLTGGKGSGKGSKGKVCQEWTMKPNKHFNFANSYYTRPGYGKGRGYMGWRGLGSRKHGTGKYAHLTKPLPVPHAKMAKPLPSIIGQRKRKRSFGEARIPKWIKSEKSIIPI